MPSMTRAQYDAILAELQGLDVNTSRLRITGSVID
jgi:hypothetical protein